MRPSTHAEERPPQVSRMAVRALPVPDQFLDCQSDVTRDFAQQGRCDVPSGMERDGRGAAVGMAVLAMRATLTSQGEAVTEQQALDLPWLQNGDRAHRLCDVDRVGPYELRFQLGLPILKQEFHDLFKVGE